MPKILITLITTGILERVLLAVARELAARTETDVDDELVKAVESAVGAGDRA